MILVLGALGVESALAAERLDSGTIVVPVLEDGSPGELKALQEPHWLLDRSDVEVLLLVGDERDRLERELKQCEDELGAAGVEKLKSPRGLVVGGVVVIFAAGSAAGFWLANELK